MDKEKYVDESWKEQATEEKDKLKEEQTQTTAESHDQTCGCGEHAQEVEVNFLNYITSLGFQAMIFMGEIANPVTNEIEKNLMQAKFLIDTLSMLKDKTAGNLDEQEKNLLENSIHELQLRYVQHVQQESTSEGKEPS